MKTYKPTLKYIRVGLSCCGDDWVQTESSRYDLERLGVVPVERDEEANLLIIQGSLNPALLAEASKFYETMRAPKFVMAVGTCSCGGGLFPSPLEGALPVHVYVTGCPPRPEAIMNGIISLREVQT